MAASHAGGTSIRRWAASSIRWPTSFPSGSGRRHWASPPACGVAVILCYFVCCGVSRLARYNVTAEDLSAGADKVAYFEGTPIPTSVAITAVLAWAAWQGALGAQMWGGAWQLGPWQLHPMSLLFALSGTLMISKTLRIPKF
jgi:phosphatidylserine synthase